MKRCIIALIIALASAAGCAVPEGAPYQEPAAECANNSGGAMFYDCHDGTSVCVGANWELIGPGCQYQGRTCVEECAK